MVSYARASLGRQSKDCKKRRIIVYTIRPLFGDANGLDWDDVAHSDRERRFKRLGLSMDKRFLLVVYTMRRMGHDKEKIRIISARQASRRERQAYARLTD